MTAAAFAIRYWREGVIALLLAACAGLGALVVHRGDQLRACQATRAIDHLTTVATTAQAQAADTLHALTVERRDGAVTQETERDLQGQLADARAAAARHAAELRAAPAPDHGGGGAAGVPAPADPARGAADPGRAAVLDAGTGRDADDARICAENTVKAAAWPAWWAQVSAPVPDAPQPPTAPTADPAEGTRR